MDITEQHSFAINLMQNMATATFVLDANGKVLIWNHACERLTGIMADEVMGTNEYWKALYSEKRICLADLLVRGYLDNIEKWYDFFDIDSDDNNSYSAGNWCDMPRLGTDLYLRFEVGPIYGADGELVAVVETLQDMTEHKNTKTALEKLILVDEMTKLSNRRYFDERLNIEWNRAKQHHLPISLIMIDVDFLSQFNDSYGSKRGDECLKAIAKTLRQSVFRGSEVVARYGGEEFCVLLPGIEADGAYSVAERIRENISDMQMEHESSHISDWVTVSNGMSTIRPTFDDQTSQLISLADAALEKAKVQGRNQSVKAVA
ncbi:hypothetical protein A9Q78_04950 [Methylophaga sp. 41_12_T18]|nr:hypothetical protein A9Q78_04950 [Methylophaga sp. 41_12_T18]